MRGCGDDVERWLPVRRVWIGREARGRFFKVEHSRTYRDRWVLKLAGVDDGDQAARLRGQDVLVAATDAPDLPDGVHYAAKLVGVKVIDESGNDLGRVEEVVMTGGTDLLRVRPSDRATEQERIEDEELLIPFAREFVEEFRGSEREIVVRLPPGLRGLNRRKP